MKRQIPGLSQANDTEDEGPEGVFLVRVERSHFQFHSQKPYLTLRFEILEPKNHTGQKLGGRLYCHAKALWKLT